MCFPRPPSPWTNGERPAKPSTLARMPGWLGDLQCNRLAVPVPVRGTSSHETRRVPVGSLERSPTPPAASTETDGRAVTAPRPRHAGHVSAASRPRHPASEHRRAQPVGESLMGEGREAAAAIGERASCRDSTGETRGDGWNRLVAAAAAAASSCAAAAPSPAAHGSPALSLSSSTAAASSASSLTNHGCVSASAAEYLASGITASNCCSRSRAR
mmetsp:Transcript_58009/g.133252  ORF Transcript_58009/g.133252 Transcript_58009/m.133252 type:complete len:215 (+) Transcript_58009:852-1496(+)